jgi:FkbM family methyltransferase
MIETARSAIAMTDTMTDSEAATLSQVDFSNALKAAHAELQSRLPRLAKLEGVCEVLLCTYGTRGRDLARQLRAAGVRCVIFDNAEAARATAAADGFEVTRDLDLGLPLIVAAGQNQIEILGELEREAYSLAEALYALNLRNSYGRARAFSDGVVTDAERLFAIYRQIDAAGRPAFLDVLAYRASLDVHHLAHRRPVGEMWRPPVSGLDIRSFCDIGAYDGDSLAATKAVFPALTRSLTIEPSAAMAPAIAAVAERIGVENRNFTGAAWSHPTRLGARLIFNGMLVIEEDAAGNIQTETLDTLAGGAVYDYIKMDVEGSEAVVIAGGVETLKRARCIAVASYHLPGDLTDLPALLRRLLGDEAAATWRLAFAHYSQSFDDSIFYLYR